MTVANRISVNRKVERYQNDNYAWHEFRIRFDKYKQRFDIHENNLYNKRYSGHDVWKESMLGELNKCVHSRCHIKVVRDSFGSCSNEVSNLQSWKLTSGSYRTLIHEFFKLFPRENDGSHAIHTSVYQDLEPIRDTRFCYHDGRVFSMIEMLKPSLEKGLQVNNQAKATESFGPFRRACIFGF